MKKTNAAAVYAAAYYPYIRDKYAEVRDILASVLEVFSSSGDLRIFLNHPKFSVKQKQITLSNIFSGMLIPEVERFLFLLVERSRIGDLADIFTELEEQDRQANGIQAVSVTSAYPLTEEEKAVLLHRISEVIGKKVVSDFTVNDSLIAGLIIKVGDKVIDTTVKTQIHSMRGRDKQVF
jgi:F-type H+-transporting ATPase subunit delta